MAERNTFTSIRGFTLVEILVVVFVIGITLSLAALQLTGNNLRQLSREAERLQLTMTLAQDQATWRFQSIGIEFYQSGYRFVRYHTDRQHWQVIIEDPMQPHPFDTPVAVELLLEDTPVPLQPSAAETPQPHLVFLASGESTPFQLTLCPESRGDSCSPISLHSDGFQTIALKQHHD